MLKRIEWYKYGARHLWKWFYQHVNSRTFRKPIKRTESLAHKRFIDRDEFNTKVAKMIMEGSPFLVARYGSTEATILYKALGVECGAIKNIKDKYFDALMELSGFFPNDKTLIPKWVEIMKDTSAQVDILCYWEAGYQEYMVDNYCTDNLQLTELDNLQPFFIEHPWTGALKGKTVLVIHPFAETIEKQYIKREQIWKNREILPEFKLITVKAVQTIAGNRDERFDTWFDALEYMYQEAMKHEFDVAIVACGAYGMPLAAKIKKAGKQAIHWGGMSQIWFGIKGGRWDNNPRVNQFYNDVWVRPSENETVADKNKVEGGCYW